MVTPARRARRNSPLEALHVTIRSEPRLWAARWLRLGGKSGDRVHRPRTRLDLELTATDDGLPTDCVVNFDNIHTNPRRDFRRQSVELEPSRLAQDCRRHQWRDSSSSPGHRGQRDSIEHTGTGEVASQRRRGSPPLVTATTFVPTCSRPALLTSTVPQRPAGRACGRDSRSPGE
jgi:hypothetical protein